MSREETQSEALGELPVDWLREQGETFKTAVGTTPNIPADIASSVGLSDAPAKLESRSQGASVISSFDTRPINATDFRTGETQVYTPGGETYTPLEFNYVVPQSYIAVLRSFEVRQNPLIIVSDLFTEPLYTLSIDGIAQIGHANLSLSQQPGIVPTHILANEGSTITLRIDYWSTLTGITAITTWVSFYGNLLLTKNVPLAFEIGNPQPARTIPLPPSVAEPPKTTTTVTTPVPGKIAIRPTAPPPVTTKSQPIKKPWRGPSASGGGRQYGSGGRIGGKIGKPK